MRSWPWLLCLLVACRAERQIAVYADRGPAPGLRDRGDLCVDIGRRRVCWVHGQPVQVPRPVPAGLEPPGGLRCGGMGQTRRCEARARNAGAFRCDASARCVQTSPRMPDDGEWDCVEMSGIVHCHRRAAAAGVADGPLDLGWLCGPRLGADPRDRVCVDLDADRPSQDRAWQCRFEPFQGQSQRVCVPAREPALASTCQDSRGCPAAMRCSDRSCLPELPRPGCWYDRDCGAGAKCRWGSCRNEPP
jgi:hypothetical protein